MSQQQDPMGVAKLSDFNTVFNERLVPTDMTGQQFILANNIKFKDNLNNIAHDFIFIDSAFRNWDIEEPNNYTIPLNKDLKYVHSIELVHGFMPSSGYIIHKHNNKFYFQETPEQVTNGIFYIVIIPEGNYEIDELSNTLKLKMAEIGDSIYTIDIDESTTKMTISTDDAVDTGIFNLIFTNSTEIVGERGFIETLKVFPDGRKRTVKVATGNTRRQYINDSVGQIIGYRPINLSGSLSYTGQNIFNLRPYDYVGIFISNSQEDDWQRIDCANTHIQGAFAIVPLLQTITASLDTTRRSIVVDNVRYIRTFNPPINMDKLKIEVRTNDGNLYEFNGENHWLLFEITRVFNREVIDRLNQLK